MCRSREWDEFECIEQEMLQVVDSGLMGGSCTLRCKYGLLFADVQLPEAQRLAAAMANGSLRVDCSKDFPGSPTIFRWRNKSADMAPVVRQMAASYQGRLHLLLDLEERLLAELRSLQRGDAGDLWLLPAMSDVQVLSLPAIVRGVYPVRIFAGLASGLLHAAQAAQFLPRLTTLIIDQDDLDDGHLSLWNSQLKFLGRLLATQSRVSVQLHPPPDIQTTEALRARVLAAAEAPAAPPAEQPDMGQQEQEELEDEDDPVLTLTAAERQALLKRLVG